MRDGYAPFWGVETPTVQRRVQARVEADSVGDGGGFPEPPTRRTVARRSRRQPRRDLFGAGGRDRGSAEGAVELLPLLKSFFINLILFLIKRIESASFHI